MTGWRRSCARSQSTGVIATNTSIDHGLLEPTGGRKRTGGVSGAPLHRLSVKAIGNCGRNWDPVAHHRRRRYRRRGSGSGNSACGRICCRYTQGSPTGDRPCWKIFSARCP